jgi:hypothetical protein
MVRGLQMVNETLKEEYRRSCFSGDGAMRGFNYIALWTGSMVIGLLAMDSYPKSDLAGVVLAGYVFVASTAMIAILHFVKSPK